MPGRRKKYQAMNAHGVSVMHVVASMESANQDQLALYRRITASTTSPDRPGTGMACAHQGGSARHTRAGPLHYYGTGGALDTIWPAKKLQ